ncbi:MAG: glycosyltransferase family 2 protein [Deltaproteobacteria bacterium]|nr:glycosyltransferase family 2 protein [Deltaproteobacteria bacterium]
MTSPRPLVSVVVPVFNESAVISTFHAEASRALGAITDADYELVFVDDGSRDDSFSKLARLSQTDPKVSVVKLSRNFGHQIAISAGLDHARGDCVAIIDADLQDPPEVIAKMFERYKEGFDVVYGVRTERNGETFFKRATASLFYRLLRSFSRLDIPLDVGDFRLLSRRAVEQLRGMREKDRFVRGLVAWLGFRQVGVEYARAPRYAGETKYPLRKMLRFALDGITSFSNFPLRLATWLGWGASLLSFLYLASVFIQKAMGITVQGWATIMVAVLFMGGVQLICLGIIGEYIGRIFNEVKPRPMYIVEEIVGARRE